MGPVGTTAKEAPPPPAGAEVSRTQAAGSTLSASGGGMDAVEKPTLTSLFAKYGGEFLRAIQERVTPLYDGKKVPDVILETVRRMRRRPFARQAHAAAALLSGLDHGLSPGPQGEMGVGKTLIAILTLEAWARMKKRPMRFLVMCPTHLVEKWREEIEKTVTAARVLRPRSLTDMDAIFRLKPRMNEYIVVSKERMKLGCQRMHAVSKSRFLEYQYPGARYFCAECLAPLTEACADNVEGTEAKETYLQELKPGRFPRCKRCGFPGWTTEPLPGGGRRHPLGHYMLVRGYRVDVGVLDEVHEYKGKGTAQGIAMQWLVRSASRVLHLTGTLCNGYSSSLFYLLYRVSRDIRREFRFEDVERWIKFYGFLQRIRAVDSTQGTQSRLKTDKEIVRELPGVNPPVFRHLVGSTVFISLKDLGVKLPPYESIPVSIAMGKKQREEYEGLERALKGAWHDRTLDPKARAQFAQVLLSWVDRPWVAEEIVNREGEIVATTTALEEKTIYPKEKRLLQIVRGELKEGRKVLIYCTHTRRRDVQGRLEALLSKEGVRVKILRSNAPVAEKRMDWIRKVTPGVDVLITHPRCVKTGLDLLEFPTFVYYEPTDDFFDLEQSSRRSWRIGQTRPVRIYHFYYAPTAQQRVIARSAKKMRAHLMVTGEAIPAGSLADLGEVSLMEQLATELIRNAPLPDVDGILAELDAEIVKVDEEAVREEEAWVKGLEETQKPVPPPTAGPSAGTQGVQMGLFGERVVEMPRRVKTGRPSTSTDERKAA